MKIPCHSFFSYCYPACQSRAQFLRIPLPGISQTRNPVPSFSEIPDPDSVNGNASSSIAKQGMLVFRPYRELHKEVEDEDDDGEEEKEKEEEEEEEEEIEGSQKRDIKGVFFISNHLPEPVSTPVPSITHASIYSNIGSYDFISGP